MAVLGKFVDEVVQDNHGDQASLTRSTLIRTTPVFSFEL
jgi:hypothetical protein